MYDVTSRDSLHDVQTKWMHEFRTYGTFPSAVQMLVANKVDLVGVVVGGGGGGGGGGGVWWCVLVCGAGAGAGAGAGGGVVVVVALVGSEG